MLCIRHLGQNKIWKVDGNSFQHTTLLRSLRLDGNRLRSVPNEALSVLRYLEVL